MNTLDHLVYMTNQIARNFGTLAEQEAAQATADHILKYWDPRMKSRIIAHAADGCSDLSGIARLAVSIIGCKNGSSSPGSPPVSA